ncbi:hypothetical protein KX816_14685 [Sphingosinicellaceae bacterium]|nr:hypothetical protein KX816_14685 [Sphingosinicellaceae bacterium]
MNKAAVVALIAITIGADMAEAKKPPEVTGLELQQIQARDIEATTDVVFSAVMTVFQDAGFRILTADKSTGLISAQSSNKSKTTYNIWYGLGKKKTVPIVSAFIESRGPNMTRARLSFVMSTGKSRSILTDEEPVTDPAAYQDAFEKIQKEVFTRQALNAQTPAAPPTTAASTVPIHTAPQVPPGPVLVAPPSGAAASKAGDPH